MAFFATASGYSLSWEYPSSSSPVVPVGQISKFVDANRASLGGSLFLEGLTAILVVVFVGLLCHLASDEDRAHDLLIRLFFASAVLTAAVSLAVGLPTGVALVQFAPSSAAVAIQILWMLNFADMVAIAFPLAFMFGVASVVIWRKHLVARWIAGVTTILGVLEVVASLGTWVESLQGAPQLPLFLSIWALLVSGGLLLERRQAAVPRGNPNGASVER